MRDGPTLAEFPTHRVSGHHASSDERLVECVAAGGRLAMETLYARHHVRVYRFVLRCMSSEHFGQLAWQFKRMSGSSGLKVQAAIAC
jgi:hypothetical protein